MTSSYRAVGAFRKRGVVSRLSDLIWPPRSLLSEEIVDRPGVIEPALWGELKFLADPLCSLCGFPLPDDAGPIAVCGACTGRKPAYDTARAALVYDDHARRLILDLKRGGRRDGLPVFARWMAAAAGETLARADFTASRVQCIGAQAMGCRCSRAGWRRPPARRWRAPTSSPARRCTGRGWRCAVSTRRPG